MKYLLQEDDCAPDSLDYFNKELKEIFNLSVGDFKNNGERFNPDELTVQYKLNSLVLEISADGPFYRFYKEK